MVNKLSLVQNILPASCCDFLFQYCDVRPNHFIYALNATSQHNSGKNIVNLAIHIHLDIPQPCLHIINDINTRRKQHIVG